MRLLHVYQSHWREIQMMRNSASYHSSNGGEHEWINFMLSMRFRANKKNRKKLNLLSINE